MGSSGLLDATLSPVETHFNEAGMCVVNVHWHLGAEHKNVGTYDIDGEEWMEQHGKTKPKGHGANVVPGHGYGYGNVKGAVPSASTTTSTQATFAQATTRRCSSIALPVPNCALPDCGAAYRVSFVAPRLPLE